MTDTRDVLLAGVGGHGVLALSRIIAEGALAAGFDVRKSEVHGMSQRGGSVISEVRYGAEVHSSLIPTGEVDVLVSLELLESLRHLGRLAPDGVLLSSDQRITPARMGPGPVPYPEDARERLEAAGPGALVLPAHSVAVELGEPRAANMVMLGAFATVAPEIPSPIWDEIIRLAFRASLHEVNLAAYRAGRELASASPPVRGAR